MAGVLKQLPRRHQLLLSGVCLATLIVMLLPSEPATASRNTSDPKLADKQLILGERLEIPLTLKDTVTAPAAQELQLKPAVDSTAAAETFAVEEPAEPAVHWSGYEVKSGDSLARIFDVMGFSPQQLYRVTQDKQANKYLLKLHPGDTLRFAKNAEGELLQLAYQISPVDTLIVSQTTKGYASEIDTKEVQIQEAFAFAEIDSSFWNAGINAGLTENQIMSIANIFGWDIDFALDLRKGDEFSVIFEKEYVDGEFVGYGRVLAAEFVNQDRKFQAILHSNGDYYAVNGNAMRKSFLRSPVKFTYISSSFNPRRLHPVTGRVRPHNGIDYAANVGTPVMSSGSGKVIASAYNNLNGNYVFIQHGERYVTKYLHLSKRTVKRGDRVKQGDLIGRVGATGRVTGAHLHYEFLVDGVHRNPRTVKFPEAESLTASEMPEFKQIADQRLAMLADNRRVFLAMR
ncbi:peptidoglycan DD-metalloendopeptidase family protein [Pseudidiomarina terrestris]|uniref:peptidoglycan DD-metalloendopeptidase family protein n=1 Tax=Pseudidiomarina terrestris TaxID=2820060 RepID=UPI0026559F5F|nr:peptidoglycan DD-metalloendopeptidase family protein [Pseudidiomarina sp. 1ASP75-5]MDN7136164.1 peptidoglycan DD-metalloendopeptidase family protein [Pseudidiomarina sp. 1ASP75-5]